MLYGLLQISVFHRSGKSLKVERIMILWTLCEHFTTLKLCDVECTLKLFLYR